MHEKLKEYFEKAEEEENKLTAQELISAGLYEKEYSKKMNFLMNIPTVSGMKKIKNKNISKKFLFN